MEEMDFHQLLESGDVDKLKGLMTSNDERITEALKHYNVKEHKINSGPDSKLVGEEQVKIWKLALPIQQKIVQNTVAFLVGKPVKLVEESEGTELAFKAVTDVWKEMRMNSKLIDLLTKFYSETEAVIMFRPYRDSDADPNDITIPNTIRCKVVAKSNNESVYYWFDEFGTLVAWAREYKVKGNKNKEIEHFDVETKEFYYNHVKADGNWLQTKKDNLAKKISMALFTQEDWDSKDVDPLIERREELTSSKAMNNDAMGSPILKLLGEVKNLPEIAKKVKVVQMEPGADAEYLYPQMSVDLIKEEREDLKELINYITDTPDMSMESMKNTTSGKELEIRFFPAALKAIRNQTLIVELFDRMMEVIKNLLVKINPNDTALATQMGNLQVKFEFVSPLPENEADYIDMLAASVGGKPILSQETAAKLHPLAKDGEENWSQIQAETVSNFDE
ncbi:phage portal protein [Sphingobacterium lactis]|uniref:phage portal protein n=1 Tax=Sphingobacterium lactis TaxID=797291 RepID=UPI003F8149F1